MQILDQYSRPFPTPEERADAAEASNRLRFDRWENQLTGVGSGIDKVNGNGHGRFFPVYRVLDQELTSLFNGSDLARHVVSRRPKEMFRRGYDIESADLSSTQTEAVREYATECLDLDTNMHEGFRWGRLYGGCLLLLNVDDGGYPWEPLDEDSIRSFNSVSLVDRRYAYVQSQYSSLNGAHYGRPEIYLISNAVAVSGWNTHGATLKKKSGWQLMNEGGSATLVHESRVIRFDGNDADIVTRQSLAGWTWSVLQVVYDALKQFEHAYDSVGYLLADASQAVFTLQGMIKAITSGQRGAFVGRLQMMEMTRSVIRGIALDAGDDKNKPETFNRIATSFASIPELLDKMMLRLSAATEEPATVLFGRAPGGLSASGDNEMRSWYDSIASEQENELSPRLKRVYRLIAKAMRGPVKGKDARFKITHRPLWTPTDSETATTLFTNAQRDNLYLTQGVVKPEEVAVDLGDVYPNLDIDAREEALKAAKSLDPYPNDPKPPTGGAGPSGPPGRAGPVTPTSASGVNGTGGEPMGGPATPFPLFGGGSIGPAKPSKGKPAATLGVPDNLRKTGGAVPRAQGANFKEHGDFDPDQSRAANGEFGEGSGGGAHGAVSKAGAAVSAAKAFFTDPASRRDTIAKAVKAIKASPAALGKKAVDAVKAQVHEAKSAFAGIRAVLGGGSMTEEQKHATKHIAVKIASSVAAAAVASAFPPSLLHGFLAEHLGEHLVKHVAKHAAEKLLKKALHLDSLGMLDGIDPEVWFAEHIAGAVADELDNMSDEDLQRLADEAEELEKGDAYDPRQPRKTGKLASHVASGMGADAYVLTDKAVDPESHHEAATAHGHAALEFRQLAARARRLGNTKAADRHEATAHEHQSAATEHTMAAGRGPVSTDDVITAPVDVAAAADEPDMTTKVVGDAVDGDKADRIDGNSTAVAVWHQLREDYPEDAISWVLHYDWMGPEDIPLSKIDFSNEDQWAASKEPASVAFHATRIADGTKKPVVLVRVAGKGPYEIADGHHRGLAYKFLKQPVSAYTVVVPKDEEGWQPMHDAQGQESHQRSQQRAPSDPVESADARNERRYPKGARWNADAGEWDSEKHPRGEHGQFGEGGESAGSPPKGEASIKPATVADFHAAFTAATKGNDHAAYVTHYSTEDLAGMKALYLSADGKAGVAIHDHGDGRIEATALFNSGAPKGTGVQLLKHAVAHGGANYVECYGPRLNVLYAQAGFREATRDTFNPAYAAANWNHERDDSPDPDRPR